MTDPVFNKVNFPPEKFGLTLEHNPNKVFYQSVLAWLEEQGECAPDFPSEEEREKAIQEENIWTLQWYPDSTVGSHYIAASTLEGVLKFAEMLQ